MKRTLVSTLLVGLVVGTTSTAHAGRSPVMPVQSNSHGQGYEDWSGDWWQWALGTPTADNSLVDATGERCAEGQSGHVWFLAGSFIGPVSRSCTVPPGTALFFPIINQAYLNFAGDPFDEETARDAVASCFGNVTASASIDGQEIDDLEDFFVESELFDVSMPAADALFGLDGVEFTPAVDAGIYLMLHPLSVGEHTIEWDAQDDCGNSQTISYDITVAP